MNQPKYYISDNNEFVIENYNSAPTFSSFFPGIAGIYGCPMWVFYANRGQAVTSAGIEDKNGAIIEFNPANKAYRAVSLTGFRTFLKINGNYYEPFKETTKLKQEMRISPDSLTLIEENPKLKVKIEVTYFTIPNEQFPALARKVKVTNLAPKKQKLEIIDGLPIIIPYGFADDLLKKICQTIEAWSVVENLENNAPYYRLKLTPSDATESVAIEKGHFFISFTSKGAVKTIVDPQIVFGPSASFKEPENFAGAKNFTIPARQLTDGFTPAALAHKKVTLATGEKLTVYSIIGQADSREIVNKIKNKIVKEKYLKDKFAENRELIDGLCSALGIASASKSFDLYSRQTFLDNVLRGGWPVKIGGKTVYSFFRKHGDMERDYNNFQLMPTPFSQGNGNYRDINQNRRNDIFFNPEIGEENIIHFFNLIQLDGFNPLVVLGIKYFIKSEERARQLAQKHLKRGATAAAMLTQPNYLGTLLHNLECKTSKEIFTKEFLEEAEAVDGANHGEGFWIDHFAYNTDALESFSYVYPDKMTDLLFNNKSFCFYDNDHIVLPRKGKVKTTSHSVYADPEKAALINKRIAANNIVHTEFGLGQPYYTTLIVKILSLVANKAASFDPAGIGLEMEADKPDWYDALNGLPGLAGSSLSETLELKRLCTFTLLHLTGVKDIKIPIEVKKFSDNLSRVFSSPDYWETSHQAKENHRQETRLGLSGRETKINCPEVRDFLNNIVKKCDDGIKKCLKKYKNYYTYFTNIPGAAQRPLPLFLEGFVHALKIEKDKNIYNLVKKSPLYDKALKMYKVNAPLKEAPLEIGRARVFTPGWLENESVWLHMEYKYMLELLKAGLYKEFFADAKDVLIPFLDPKTYKRSILENSSFLVSSAHPNKANHGRGFIARLSGATAEFIDMWLLMTTGKQIFYLDNQDRLCFKLAPSLPAWLFNKGKLSFTLLGTIEVTYLNKTGKNTFDDGVSPVAYKLIIDDKEVGVNSPFITGPYAELIRERKVKRLIVTLG
ncbi:hypothetical protein A3H38_01710 [candidate division WOR-1 bacterium RIFCSPLOWO2_02_FULL_46_20]|uniref:Cellobiose phosphorylase n=1 Tax=candidate division WOR-1 bacterium RIFCSPLOWO2_02_FULL_46_20 TaxID=1802567 RepID=A0A1F4RH47_UNCSA|nr:MAG: hypothetical protein A3J44_03725 [candidate division WOR-1 bacterium RIFCSPHIGHO2_02_FULL_45_12]OGC07505.1 MAG: hypothetical protein A3H38_01710 [candidate division WOR-1 bacterium RIFCSPLOWO2_02_FULL_46_20]